RKVMVILVLEHGLVKEELVRMDGPVQLKEITKIIQLLNSRFSGWTLAEIRGSLLKEAEKVKKVRLSILETALKLIDNALNFKSEEIHMEGATHLVEQPEFKAAEKMERVVRLIEQKQPLGRVLGRQWLTPGLTVEIGHESPDAALKDFSFVHVPCYFQGKVVGALGVLGPTRMAYGRVTGVVRHLARHLEETLTRNGGSSIA
ncbi:MAG TPA: HrcA family transcriptional regulator, partial [bacterium]